MRCLDWDKRFETGIASIDYEHRRLVELLNQLAGEVAEGTAGAAVGGTLGEFHAIATAHFALEEAILEFIKDPRYEQRRQAHARLIDQVRDIMDGYEAGAYDPPAEVANALCDWMGSLIGMDAEVFADLDEAALMSWNLRRR